MNFQLTKLSVPSLWAFILLFTVACHKDEIPVRDYTNLVVPTVDSANSRWFFFNSACRPFGMVNLSPDTQTGGAWGSGYRYNTDTIQGFSHVHAWQLAGPSVMPVTEQADESLISPGKFFSAFSHANEEIHPGYHHLFLDRYQIDVELTATKRVGFHRYHFASRPQQAAVLFNLNGQLGPSLMAGGHVEQRDSFTLLGEVTNKPTIRRPKDCTVYFAAQFNSPVKSIEQDSLTGNYTIRMETPADSTLLMKLAISYTSTVNALANMTEELPGWDFEAVKADARNEWNSMLARIQVEGGTPEQQKRFYTDLWHALQGRRTISDVNGAYPDNTGEHFGIGQLPLGENGKPLFNHYNSDSFWGAQWTINTLWGLVYPEMMVEFTQSMMQFYHDGGLVPRGPSGGNYTYVMTGASSSPFIISAIQKGLVKDSLEQIYQALKKNHMPGGIMEKAGYEHSTAKGGGLSYYIEKGYVPYPIPEGEFGLHQDGASLTLEYAYQDWCLAQLAQKLGHTDDYQYFLQRSQNYRNVYEAESGWMRPKDVAGTWKADFDPYQHEHGFIEANAAQSSWFVPHDLQGLAGLMGGNEAAASKLNQSFEEAEKQGFTIGNSHDVEHHPEFNRVPINYGNQPSIQTAFIFNYFGQPWLTQYWSRQVVETVYEGLSPQRGYNGDEDQGLMGSLAVLMKLGLFSMDGGCASDPTLELGSPLFDKVTIQLNPDFYPGKQCAIVTRNNSAENQYIQSVKLNGKELNSWKLPQAALEEGGTIEIEMGNQPNTNWGVKTKK